ncbi:hypothetical protein QFZ28_003283 [Neobacillus niacini]|nr:hypothetical protein [Neobacillus niacini]
MWYYYIETYVCIITYFTTLFIRKAFTTKDNLTSGDSSF